MNITVNYFYTARQRKQKAREELTFTAQKSQDRRRMMVTMQAMKLLVKSSQSR